MMFIPNRRKHISANVIRASLIVAVFFLIAGVSAVRERATRILFFVAAPVWRAGQTLRDGADDRSSFLKGKQALIEENNILQEENRSLIAALYMMPVLQKENRELKEILGRRPSGKRLLLTRVLAQPNRSPYDILVVDKGEGDGIGIGDIATAYGNIALGAVERVYVSSSVVRLFSSPGEEIAAYIGEEGVPVSATGRGGGNFSVRVPKGISVNEGDPIVSDVALVPLLGIVGSVDATPSDSFQDILFQTPINIYTLKWVEILLDSGREGIESRK